MRSKKALEQMVLSAVVVVLAVAGPAFLVHAQAPDSKTAENVVDDGAASAESEVVLYYFHGERRCNTCRKIESYAQRAVETKFADELEAGTLQWKVLNTDDQANEHFVKDFDLVSSSLVVVEMDGGNAVRHDVLQDAWTLVRDEPRFIEYIQKSVDEYLE